MSKRTSTKSIVPYDTYHNPLYITDLVKLICSYMFSKQIQFDDMRIDYDFDSDDDYNGLICITLFLSTCKCLHQTMKPLYIKAISYTIVLKCPYSTHKYIRGQCSSCYNNICKDCLNECSNCVQILCDSCYGDNPLMQCKDCQKYYCHFCQKINGVIWGIPLCFECINSLSSSSQSSQEVSLSHGDDDDDASASFELSFELSV